MSFVVFSQKFDFIYSFDCLVHVDLHTQFSYFQQGNFFRFSMTMNVQKQMKCQAVNCSQISQNIKPKTGFALIHTSNLEAPNGWKRFEKQKKFSVRGFYCVFSCSFYGCRFFVVIFLSRDTINDKTFVTKMWIRNC